MCDLLETFVKSALTLNLSHRSYCVHTSWYNPKSRSGGLPPDPPLRGIRSPPHPPKGLAGGMPQIEAQPLNEFYQGLERITVQP
ncbi:MAG: hypothetical protein OHK0047_30060 [Leptolyngbyaceae cyanobacterium]